MNTRRIGRRTALLTALILVWSTTPSFVSAQPVDPGADSVALNTYYPPSEDLGGWRSLLPDSGEPGSEHKAKIRDVAGVDWDRLKAAWDHNAAAPGSSGLLVIRKGFIVGEWYKDGDRNKTYNIYSSSKSYTSTAFGLILADFGHGPLPDGRKLTLDTLVCNPDWIPETLPLPDPRKATITVRNLLNMTSGLDVQNPPIDSRPFEWSLGHVDGSPMTKLLAEPGTTFHYSNAGVSHLVLLFNHAVGEDLYPFMKRRVFDQIGMRNVKWMEIGGKGGIGPYNQGYSGIFTTPREHARFCYMAMHKGEWQLKRIVPASYFDFAWAGTKAKADYGAQWWTAIPSPGIPKDLVMTRGRDHNDGFIVPSLDLVFVRLGDGDSKTFPNPKEFEKDLVSKVLGAIVK